LRDPVEWNETPWGFPDRREAECDGGVEMGAAHPSAIDGYAYGKAPSRRNHDPPAAVSLRLFEKNVRDDSVAKEHQDARPDEFTDKDLHNDLVISI